MWLKRYPIITGLIGLAILIAPVGCGNSSTPTTKSTTTANEDLGMDTPSPRQTTTKEDQEFQDMVAENESAIRKQAKHARSASLATASPASRSQKRALESARQYLDLTGMSKRGVIRQLSSAADGFSRSDATYAANHVHADWNQEAVESARSYLDLSPMSKAALIRQLTSSVDGFTLAQATYAANKVY